ncbi:MAG TPA: cysteine desulfurase family protein [Pirellulales bacterium]|jgi:cysteine desulfurase|nr:cysteine desulfurase family protein [Pirellulales bacterium]
MQPIYFDQNATTPLDPEVAAAMAECQQRFPANPASAHQAGRRARQVLEDAREKIALLLGARLAGLQPDRLIFTSGGTEANNLALLGLGPIEPAAGTTITSPLEHPSVLGAAAFLRRSGGRIEHVSVAETGAVRLDSVRARLESTAARQAGPIRLVSLMLANNETGVLQPIAEVGALCQAAGVLLHTDAVQAVGKVAVDFRALSAAALTLAPHKFSGPRGIGALLVRGDIPVRPALHGGFQQEGLRPGTESVALAVGMCRALERFVADQPARTAHLASLRERFEAGVRTVWPGATINGLDAARLPQTSNVAFIGLDRQSLFLALDLAGIACSTGSACASGSSDPSPTLLAMGCADQVVRSSLRFSFGITNTHAEVEEALARLARVCERLAPC